MASRRQDLLAAMQRRSVSKEKELQRVANAEQKSNSVLRQRNVLLEAKVAGGGRVHQGCGLENFGCCDSASGEEGE